MGADEKSAMRARRYAEAIKELKSEQNEARRPAVPEFCAEDQPHSMTMREPGEGARVVQSAQFAILALGIDDRPAEPMPPALREAVHSLVSSAANDCGLAQGGWQSAELNGNLVMQIPSYTSLGQLAGPLIKALDARLRDRFREPGHGPVRLRVAVHAGQVLLGRQQHASPAVGFACRLADAELLHDTLAAAPGARLAAIVSDEVFQDVIVHARRLVDTASYLSVPLGASGEVGWVTVPGYSAPPGISAARPAADPQAARPARDPAESAGQAISVGVVQGNFINRQDIHGNVTNNYGGDGHRNGDHR